MNLLRPDRDYGKTSFGLPAMPSLHHFAKLFSATPSALRAVLLGFGLAFAATDPSVAVVGKAGHLLVQLDPQAAATQAHAASDRAAERELR